MTFHCSIILLVQPFLGRNSPIEPPTPCHHRAQSIISASLRELRHLITLHDRYHGWDNAIPFVLHSISITGFGSLDEISTLNPTPTHLALEASEPYFGLLTCIRALRDISKFIYYAQPLFRLLTQASQAMDVRLPDEIMQAFKEYTSEEWTKFASCMVSSQYVADMRNAVTDLEKRRMDDIIAQWGALTLREKENEDEIPRKSEDVPFRTSKAPPMT